MIHSQAQHMFVITQEGLQIQESDRRVSDVEDYVVHRHEELMGSLPNSDTLYVRVVVHGLCQGLDY